MNQVIRAVTFINVEKLGRNVVGNRPSEVLGFKETGCDLVYKKKPSPRIPQKECSDASHDCSWVYI